MLLGATDFEIGMAVVGGLLISIATSFHLLVKGRVTGMSGTFYSILVGESSNYWKICLIGGMI